MRKKWLGLVLAMVAALSMTVISGCASNKDADASVEKTSIKVGVTPGPHAEIMEVVQKVAAQDGLKIEIIEFSDYIQPNVALNQSEIDVNSYQHQPFLDAQVKDRGYKIETLAKTILFPMGVYSKNLTAIQQVPENSVIAIPNDPSNGGRALNILEKAGLIKLKENAGLSATAADIVENPKNIEFDANYEPALMTQLYNNDEGDAVLINSNFAIDAGINPLEDSIAIEDSESPYVNIVAVQKGDENNAEIKALIEALKSEKVQEFILEEWGGAVVPVE